VSLEIRNNYAVFRPQRAQLYLESPGKIKPEVAISKDEKVDSNG
jgi:hypothetical protein